MAAEKVSDNRINGLGAFVALMGLLAVGGMVELVILVLSANSDNAGLASLLFWLLVLADFVFAAGLLFYLQSHYNILADD